MTGLVLTLFVGLGALLSGCNSGLLVALLLLDDDDGGGKNGTNTPGSAEGVEVRIVRLENRRLNPSDSVLFFELASPDDRSNLQVTVEYMTDDSGGFQPATLFSSGVGSVSGNTVSGLDASTSGVGQRVGWDAVADLGSDRSNRVDVRVTLDDGRSDLESFLVGNDAPSISNVLAEVVGSGRVRFTFRLSDPDGDSIGVELRFPSDEGGEGGGGELRTSFNTDADVFPGPVSDEEDLQFEWSSVLDLGPVDREVVIQLLPVDQIGGVQGKAGLPANLSVLLDNNADPIVAILPESFDMDATGSKAIEILVQDVESDFVDVAIQYSVDGNYPELPEGLVGEADRRREFLESDAGADDRQQSRIISMLPDPIEGPVEESTDGTIIATWIKRAAELRGLTGLGSGEGVAQSVVGRKAELIAPDGSTKDQGTVCGYNATTGRVSIRGFADTTTAEPGEILRIDLGGVVSLASSPEGIRHRVIWNRPVDAAGGGDVEVRITPFDAVREVVLTGADLCGDDNRSFPDGGLAGGMGLSASRAAELLGRFRLRDQIVEPLRPESDTGGVATAHFDDNGLLDIALVSSYSAGEATATDLVVLYQNEAGFLDPVRFGDARIGQAADLAIADIDGDGRLDVAVIGEGSSAVSGDPVLAIFLQRTDKVFASPVIIPTDLLREPSAVEIADINGDDELDIVVSDASSSTSPVVVFFNGARPSGGCAAAVEGFAACPIGSDLSALDMTVTEIAEELSIVTSQSSGFTILATDGSVVADSDDVPGSIRALDVGDVDGDGRKDIVLADSVTGGVQFVRQLENGDFSTEAPIVGATQLQRAVEVVLADLGGGDRLDVVVVQSADDGSGIGVCVDTSDVDATYTCDVLVRPEASGRNPRRATVGDFDGDGGMDVVTTDSGIVSGNSRRQELAVYLQDGGGSFLAARAIADADGVVERPRSLASGDLNGDGRVDLVSLNVAGRNLSVLRQGSAGAVNQGDVDVDAADGPLAVFAADVNGDGRGDIVSANRDSGDIAIRFQSASGVFPADPQVRIAVPAVGIESLSVADIDGDGRLDIVTAGRISDDVYWIPQDASGGFADPIEIEGGALKQPIAILAADVDLDGRVDVVVAGHESQNVVVFYQDAERGNFTERVDDESVGDMSPVDLAGADVKSDRDIDIIVAGLGVRPLMVLSRQAEGGFSRAEIAGLDGVVATAVTAADLNGDGYPDIALTDADETDPAIHVILGADNGFSESGMRKLISDDMRGPTSIVAVDFDGDGALDLVTANRASDNITVFHGGR
ncbi:MAG: VCBS repeat-containing protein [Planctomycetota bacterium]